MPREPPVTSAMREARGLVMRRASPLIVRKHLCRQREGLVAAGQRERHAGVGLRVLVVAFEARRRVAVAQLAGPDGAVRDADGPRRASLQRDAARSVRLRNGFGITVSADIGVDRPVVGALL